MSVLCAVSVHPIMLLVFRAVQGIGTCRACVARLDFEVLTFDLLGAAMTLPSAIAMIVQNFPDPAEQGRALSIFGAFGAVGNIIGFVLVSTSRLPLTIDFFRC